MCSPEQTEFMDSFRSNGFNVIITHTDPTTCAIEIKLVEQDDGIPFFEPHVARATMAQNGNVYYHTGALPLGWAN